MELLMTIGGMMFIGSCGVMGIKGISSIYKNIGLEATAFLILSATFLLGVLKAMFFSIIVDFENLASGKSISTGFHFSGIDWFFLIGFVVCTVLFMVFAYRYKKKN